MAGAKGRTRQSRGLVDMSETESSEDFLSQFDPDDLTEAKYDFDLGQDGRCIQKMLFHRGRVVWFAIMQDVLVEGEWQQVARADTCHDEAHLHRFERGRRYEIQRRIIRKVATVDDVESGFDQASDLITDEWEENVRRWNR